MSSIDTADEAGGEAIYSSDGLPQLVVPRVPTVAGSFEKQDGNDILDSGDHLDPQAAASVFTRRSGETAFEKLARLQREVAELGKEMENNDVSKLAAALASRLEAGAEGHRDLNALIEAHIDKTAGTNLSKDSTTASKESTASSMEARLSKLEKMIGGTDGDVLFDRLKALEEKMNHVDDKALDNAATRAKIIRSDLEAASKARSKLSTSSSSADNKTIAELHTQLVQLEGVSEQLPVLTARLQQLAHLHVNAANFISRLSEAEKSLFSVQSSLDSLENTVGTMEQGLVENLKTMDANLKALESRLS